MNHKLRVLVRVDVDPGRVTLEVTGCLTPSDFPALLHITRRAGRLGAGNDVVIDLLQASHLDPEVLLELRSLAEAGSAALEPASGTADGVPAGKQPFSLTIEEPADLPICLLHTGPDGEVLAGLDGELAALPLLDTGLESPADGPADLSAAGLVAPPAGGLLDPGLDSANSPIPAELNTFNGMELTEYFEDTLDPAAAVRALSDVALGQLADALYRHLDTSNPSFGAHTWYELATEELQNRHLDGADEAGVSAGPAEDELAAGLA